MIKHGPINPRRLKNGTWHAKVEIWDQDEVAGACGDAACMPIDGITKDNVIDRVHEYIANVNQIKSNGIAKREAPSTAPGEKNTDSNGSIRWTQGSLFGM